MISLGIAGLIVAPVSQGVPAGAASEGVIEFLQLFERALGSGIVAQVTDRPVLDISDQRSAIRLQPISSTRAVGRVSPFPQALSGKRSVASILPWPSLLPLSAGPSRERRS